MPRPLGRDTVVLTTPGTKTVHGSTVDDWDHPGVPRIVKRCYAELSVTDEDLEHRDADLAMGTVYDAVDGRGLDWHSYSGQLDHVTIPIKRWEG
jgi:hypothetical protein